SDHLDLYRMNVLLSRRMRRRGHRDDVDGWQPKFPCRIVIDARRCRPRVDERETHLRSGKRRALSEKLLGDVLLDTDRDLNHRAALLKSNERWNLPPARILSC